MRQQFLLNYADYLHCDPSLWRITVDYMCACGDIGKERADEVLLRVPIPISISPRRPQQQGDEQTDMVVDDEAAQLREGRVEGVLKDVIKACFEYGRESVRRMVCAVS